ncbi:MAG: hypothetical protein S0880_07955 [Actinomycetota bacterium]|nr:hypothetical protein [Actinomycetota bacterium]
MTAAITRPLPATELATSKRLAAQEMRERADGMRRRLRDISDLRHHETSDHGGVRLSIGTERAALTKLIRSLEHAAAKLERDAARLDPDAFVVRSAS